MPHSLITSLLSGFARPDSSCHVNLNVLHCFLNVFTFLYTVYGIYTQQNTKDCKSESGSVENISRLIDKLIYRSS